MVNRKPTVSTGFRVGALLTAPLIAIFYLASQAAGLPFIPFDLLDWATRTLPGGVITFGIDLIVSIIAALKLGETSSAAKTAEHIVALAGVVLVGALAGAALFAFLRARDSERRSLPGLLLGLLLGIPALSISAYVNTNLTADPFFRDLWVVGAFAVWGITLNRIYGDLQQAEESPVQSSEKAIHPAPHTGEALKSPLHAMERGFRGEVVKLDRRQFMIRLGGATAVITVVGAGLGALIASSRSEPVQSLAWSDNNLLPNANASLQPAPGTRPEFTKVRDHYRVDINALPIIIHEQNWDLEITGLVGNPTRLTLDDLRDNYEPTHQFITLSCISNPVGGDLIGTQRWTGVSLQQIVRDAAPLENARYLNIVSGDGFYESVSMASIDADERIMLTYAWDGLPLAPEHGFPLRIYIPDLYGMKQPKWIVRIELTDTPEEGYWVRRGWDEAARVRATSVIDTVAADSLVEEGDQTLVPVGGIAYAGARGISKVEVQVDDGEWREAQSRDPMSDTTWVIWRYDWPFQSGDHTFAVRCLDGSGQPQIEDERGTHPSGATGIDSQQARL